MRNPQTVLVVDADAATRMLYERALQPDYEVFTAASEQEVSELLASLTRLGALVLEPGPLNSWGWGLPARLRRHPRLSAAAIIICTAQDERRRGLELGAAEYLVKPVPLAALLLAVRRHIRPATPEGETR
jgi:DNA-binding response OmpR family regulator